MNTRIRFYLFLVSLTSIACQEDTLPKPNALLSLEYPEAIYSPTKSLCPYTFKKNDIGHVTFKNNCNAVINYPRLNGALYLTYRPVNGDITTLLRDAQKLTYEHTRKADNIWEDRFANVKNNTYGMFYNVEGNAASQSQFYVTDSTNHFITGSIYFNAKPNYDSILPAATYLKNDIRYLMETLEWQD